MEKAMLFINFSNEDFEWTWNNEPYQFPAGSKTMLPDWLHAHFTKHLVDRELQKLGVTVDFQGNSKMPGIPSRKMMEDMCAGNLVIENKSKAKQAVEILNTKIEEEPKKEEPIGKVEEKPKRKWTRHVKKLEEENFEGNETSNTPTTPTSK